MKRGTNFWIMGWAGLWAGVLALPLPAQDNPPSDPPAAEKSQEEMPDASAGQEPSAGQEGATANGDEELEKAIALKAKAKSTRELDEVVQLCEAAIAKGLDDESKKLAETVIKSTLLDHARQLTEKVYESLNDSRWRFTRREALSRLDKLIKLDPKLGEAYLLTARLKMLREGNLAEARAALNKAVEHSIDNPAQLSEALLIRAALAEDEQDQLADLNQAIVIDSSNVRALLTRGQYHATQQDYPAAVADFRAAIEQGYDGLDARLTLIQCLIADEQLEVAETELSEAVAGSPEEPALLGLRAQLRSAQKQYEQALSDIDEVLEAKPKDLAALMLKASVLYELKRYEDARATADEALETQPDLVRGYLLRGLANAALKNYDTAIEDIKVLVKADPANPGFRLQLALFYGAAKKSEEAIKLYDEILEEDPDNDSAVRGRGDAYLNIGEHAKAIVEYERAIELQQDDPDAGTINNLAWVLCTSPLSEIRDGARAVELSLRACELIQYEESYAVSTLAAAYAETGDFERAREFAAKAVELGEKEQSESLENLRRELEGYQRNKPWREMLKDDTAGPEGEETRKSEVAEQPEKSSEPKSSGTHAIPSDEKSKPDDSANPKKPEPPPADDSRDG
jgi:tetratricopeptide (TPR) repeat protein